MSGTIVARILVDNAFYQTYGELPRIGSFAPDFSLVNTKLQDVSLANWIGLRKIVNILASVDNGLLRLAVRTQAVPKSA